MIRNIPRRLSLKLLSVATLIGLGGKRRLGAQDAPAEGRADRLEDWDLTRDRVWLGRKLWANPMEDWTVSGGWAECQTDGSGRNIHSLTHQLRNTEGSFTMSVRAGQAEPLPRNRDRGAGFRIGVRSDIDELRSNCFARGGLDIGLVGDELVIGPASKPLEGEVDREDFLLRLSGRPSGEHYELTLELVCPESGETVDSLVHGARSENVAGHIALASQFSGPPARSGNKGYRFRDWRASGDALQITPENRFGPLLWSMYTLGDSRGEEGFVLKMTAFIGPMGEGDNQTVELQAQRGGAWETLGEAPLDTEAWTATFRVPNWDESEDTPYRLLYRERRSDGSEEPDEWSGIVKANPQGRPLRLGALTCQNDYAFPYAPVADNLVKLDPDMLYFSGDQLYESHGGFGVIREPAGPAILNYLRKYYQFGWAFREAMKDRPTVCLPDDHDVFHGNLWGEGGAALKFPDQGTSSQVGYIQPASMVNVVHRTHVSHHPDPADPLPGLQGIVVYHGELVYGGTSFAIVADRQWKSGPEHVDTGEGRPDHVSDPDFDTLALDKPGLVLLGERQEEFLREWAEDWRGHTMKVLLSQSVFAGVATHHGQSDNFLKADIDSNGWPQTPRNRAIDIIRPAMALHISGDQHLATLSQYGVAEQRDSCWAYCTPAIAVGYQRWWRPDELGMPHANRPAHGLEHTGEYLDGLGNKVYVYAVGNPEPDDRQLSRYDRAHLKASGFGLVTIDTEERTYTIDAFRFLVDATDGDPDNQFPGWPVTIHQSENRGENLLA